MGHGLIKTCIMGVSGISNDNGLLAIYSDWLFHSIPVLTAYTLWYTYKKAIEHGQIEFVDLPPKKMIFHSYVKVCQRDRILWSHGRGLGVVTLESSRRFLISL